ncbi:flagellar biosynthetic protein FliO [Sodalis sp. dw_96]|uniref:flagellar biosynthetic protein FliO n=1 Tax=Sodalis sp. dw_96 TaxID=2719794 RepID=UPI0021038D98|nr:flagellar biosynthetic protein FliO [Sodalis sp. dw_96]
MPQSVQTSPPEFNATGALTQVGAALGAILLVIVIGAWLVRKLGLAPMAKPSQALKVRASCSVGQRERVVVVEVEGTWLVLGVTAQNITPLHTLPAPEDEGQHQPSPRTGDFRLRLRHVMSRAGKEQ